MDEISVLDYLKFKLNPKNFGKELLPDTAEAPEGTDAPEAAQPARRGLPERAAAGTVRFFEREQTLQWEGFSSPLVLAAVLLALAAQLLLEPTVTGSLGRKPLFAGILYGLCALCPVVGLLSAKKSPILRSEKSTLLFAESVRYEFLLPGMGCALAAFLLFGGNRFTFINIFFWLLSLILCSAAFAECEDADPFTCLWRRLRSGLASLPARMWSLQISLSPWNLLCIAVFGIGVFFRFYLLKDVPLDMFSDQAEKLYDVMDVLDGKTPIFFVRNTGREAFQFYWTALMIRLFGTGVSFLSLKIGTALAGIFILPFVYQLGKRIGNRWVGLIAMLLCGTAYWPNVIGRVALRFAFYPMFTAPALYFLYKGLQERSRKALIGCGIFLGLGLHGYSPFRIVPLVCLILFLIWLAADVIPENRGNARRAFMVVILFAFLVFLPLMRVTVDMPEAVIYRSVTRLGEAETVYTDSPLKIFFTNVWKALIMPFWDDGQTWVHSIVFRPALDHFTAAFFFIGTILLLLRGIRRKNRADLLLLLTIPLLELPSTLSLAFPNENPSLNRTGGALIPVFLTAAFGFCWCFENLLRWIRERLIPLLALSAGALFILVNIVSHNYDLVFVQYASDYARNAWNTTQVGSVIRGFAESIGTYEDAYVIPNPHWVDTRLVGINAGDPKRDYALDRSLIETLPPTDNARLFIFRESDTDTQDLLWELFPQGLEQLHIGPYSGKNFYSYLVPGTD